MRHYKLKKRELAARWVAAHQSLLACPICQAGFEAVTDQGLRCANGHQWDFNRAGSVHFLTGASSENAYDREMLAARRRVLSAGLFDPIIVAVAKELPAAPQRIIDVGTGEGTPLARLNQVRGEIDTLTGFDISKVGVQLATQLAPDQLFFSVADLRHLPFATASWDLVLELFSPADYAEFDRVLAPGGRLIKVVPTGDYLRELRALLYPAGDAHRHYDNHLVKERFLARFPGARVVPVRAAFALPAALRADLVAMSPLHWGQAAMEPNAAGLASLSTVTVAVELLIAEKSAGNY